MNSEFANSTMQLLHNPSGSVRDSHEMELHIFIKKSIHP